MASYPESVIQKAAEVRLRQYESEYSASHLSWRDFAGEVREMLDAVAADLGEAVAAKIRAHMETHGPLAVEAAKSRWRRYFGICERIAARAFLSEDDVKRMAARAIARGDFVACPSPEDGDEC